MFSFLIICFVLFLATVVVASSADMPTGYVDQLQFTFSVSIEGLNTSEYNLHSANYSTELCTEYLSVMNISTDSAQCSVISVYDWVEAVYPTNSSVTSSSVSSDVSVETVVKFCTSQGGSCWAYGASVVFLVTIVSDLIPVAGFCLDVSIECATALKNYPKIVDVLFELLLNGRRLSDASPSSVLSYPQYVIGTQYLPSGSTVSIYASSSDDPSCPPGFLNTGLIAGLSALAFVLAVIVLALWRRIGKYQANHFGESKEVVMNIVSSSI